MMKLHKALALVAEYEKEQFVHSVEMMQILAMMNAPEDLQVAGLLYGLSKTSKEAAQKIKEQFGEGILELAQTPGTVEDVEDGDICVQLLVMADCVASLRRLTHDYELYGDDIWKYCRTTKELQSWYYSEVQDQLCDMVDDEDAKEIYWEFVHLYKDLFVTYYLDDEEGKLYQIAHGLYGYCLTRGVSLWDPIEDMIPEGAEVISREDAEAMEDLWAAHQDEPFQDETLNGNEWVREAIRGFREREDKDSLETLVGAICERIAERGHVILPIEDGIEDGHIIPRTITTDEGETVMAAFTDLGEMKKGPDSEVLSIRYEHLFEIAKELDDVGGIVLNPWGEFMYVGKDLISIIEEQAVYPEDDDEEIMELLEIPSDSTLLN